MSRCLRGFGPARRGLHENSNQYASLALGQSAFSNSTGKRKSATAHSTGNRPNPQSQLRRPTSHHQPRPKNPRNPQTNQAKQTRRKRAPHQTTPNHQILAQIRLQPDRRTNRHKPRIPKNAQRPRPPHGKILQPRKHHKPTQHLPNQNPTSPLAQHNHHNRKRTSQNPREELENVKFAVKMLQDASELKVVPQYQS